jgi:hypothetical protein
LTTEEKEIAAAVGITYPRIQIDNEKSFDIWKPVMKVVNLVNIDVQDVLESVRVILLMDMGNGTGVFLNIIMHVTFSCDMNFDKFPFDSQVCIFNVSFSNISVLYL